MIGHWTDLPEDVRRALHKAQDWSRTRNPNAHAYIMAIPTAIREHGQRGLSTQLLYIAANLGGWRGEEARSVKKILNDYQKSLGN